MKEQLRHEMILEKTYPSGTDEWYCPMCGRRMLINWQPQFKRTVLEAGDPRASHGGFKGGQQLVDLTDSSMNESSLHDETIMPIEEDRLSPWSAWIEETGFENLWDSDVQ